MSEKTVNDAKTGDVVTLYGTRWTVIGFLDRPAALLEREDVSDMPVNQRTHHSVILGTQHAEDFKLPDPAKALVEKWEETGCHIPKGRTAYEAFAQFLIDTGRFRSGE